MSVIDLPTPRLGLSGLTLSEKLWILIGSTSSVCHQNPKLYKNITRKLQHSSGRRSGKWRFRGASENEAVESMDFGVGVCWGSSLGSAIPGLCDRDKLLNRSVCLVVSPV